jgi:sigma-B regulation protein RsbU (phosphoserine phosphatase)
VGGDYYDYISISDGQLGLVIGDVSGKGMPAALIMASFRASLIAEIRNNYAISTNLSKVNALLFESTEASSFVTSVYGVLDPAKRAFTYVNAGHNYPLWVRGDGGLRGLETGGTVLGAFPDSSYEEERLELAVGDALVFYTDGVMDARNGGGEMFGEERLLALVQRVHHHSASEIRKSVLEAVNTFVHGAPQFDDITLIVLKVV